MINLEKWVKGAIKHSSSLVELLRIPLDENLKTECRSAVENLQPILEPVIEKIETKRHGKKEAFWDKRRQGNVVSRRYFIQQLSVAYFRCDNGDTHCSEVTKVENATQIFNLIDERGVRKILEDIKGIDSEYTANLSLAYSITPETDAYCK